MLQLFSVDFFQCKHSTVCCIMNWMLSDSGKAIARKGHSEGMNVKGDERKQDVVLTRTALKEALFF